MSDAGDDEQYNAAAAAAGSRPGSASVQRSQAGSNSNADNAAANDDAGFDAEDNDDNNADAAAAPAADSEFDAEPEAANDAADVEQEEAPAAAGGEAVVPEPGFDAEDDDDAAVAADDHDDDDGAAAAESAAPADNNNDDEGFDAEDDDNDHAAAAAGSKPGSAAGSRPRTAASQAASRPGTSNKASHADAGGDGDHEPAQEEEEEDDGIDPAASRSIQDPNYVPVAFNDDEDDLMLFGIPALPEDTLDQLQHVTREVAAAELPDRLAQLRMELEDQTIMVGTVSLDDVKLEEASLEKDRIASVQADLARHQKREQDLLARELDARKRLNAERQTSVLEDREEAMAVIARSMISTREQQTAFRKAEERLKAVLRDEQATVDVEFGNLGEDTSGVKGRRYAVNWDNAPRLVCVKNMVLRAVKNKLLPGRYVMLVTLFDRLGGVPLKWSKLKDFNYFHRTRNPVRHNGRFHDIEISFKQRINKVFLACPSKNDTTPSMCFVFELFQIRNSGLSKTDKVVAWGAFPLADPTFDVIKGYFKVPLLRGEMDPSIDRYEELEHRMASNVDNWLCNLYFTVEHWPRYMNGRREYDVELKFTHDLLRLPEHTAAGPTKMALLGDDDDELLDDDDEASGGWKGLWGNTQAGAAANAALHGPANRGNNAAAADNGIDSIIRGLNSNGSGGNSATESLRSPYGGAGSDGSGGAGSGAVFGGVGAGDPGKNRNFDVMMSLDKLRAPEDDAASPTNGAGAGNAADKDGAVSTLLGDDGMVKGRTADEFLAKLSKSVKPAVHSVKTRRRAAPMDIFQVRPRIGYH